MLDDPGGPEALDAVIEFLLGSVLPLLPPREAFETRVAANALGMVRREMTVGMEGERAELRRLKELLGQDGDLATLNAELCRRIAGGEVDVSEAAVAAHLWAVTLEKLAVDQPRYAAYLRVLSERSKRTATE